MQPECDPRLEDPPAGTLKVSGGLRLCLPQCGHGIGDVITDIDSPRLIEDLEVAPVALWPDDRGYFLEIARLGDALMSEFPVDTTQISASLSYPGTIKAFHYHVHQTDVWVPCQGMLQTVLVDLRVGSPTFGRRNTLYIGTLRPWKVRIPPGVAHGYKVVGDTASLLVYVTNRTYDPSDEGRLPYDSPQLAYDWETQHK